MPVCAYMHMYMYMYVYTYLNHRPLSFSVNLPSTGLPFCSKREPAPVSGRPQVNAHLFEAAGTIGRLLAEAGE